MKNTFKYVLCAALLPALLLAGCSRRDEASVGTPANPLLVLLSPAHAPAEPAALAYIQDHLQKATGLSVKVEAAATPADAISRFGSDKADAGLVTLEGFLVAREEYGVVPGLQALRGSGLADYEGVLLARSDGGPKTLADLAGMKIGFVGPYSVSGFTLPVIYLEKAGVKAGREFSTGHDENVRKLLDGQVAAAATYARQAGKHKGLRVLAVTGRVPNEPVVFRAALAEAKREALKAAFVSLAATREGRKALGTVADITGFKPVSAEVYRPLHELLRAEGKSVYDLMPEGWAIHRLSQPYMQGL